MNRSELLGDFLKKNGWETAVRVPLAADASFRTYERLCLATGQTAILMNAPAPENPAQFVLIDNLLQQAGIRVPRILATDLENGFLLLEDLGEKTFSYLLDHGESPDKLYRQAIETLIQLQQNCPPLHQLPLYDADKMIEEVLLLPDWFGHHVVGGLSPQAREDFISLWYPLIQRIQRLPQSMVLLDYHVDNLMIAPDGLCAVLDFQDARQGPALYDVMSLLADQRRLVDPTLKKQLLHFYQQAMKDTTSLEDVSLLALQRHTKVIGIFTRLFVRDNKKKYLHFIPFVWSLLESELNTPLTTSYRAWLECWIPKEKRRSIPFIGDAHD